MASGVALRESVKEMKRLKNEPLLMLAIIAIILFVGFFVVYPVIRVITFPSGQDYMQLFQKARWFTALKNSLFMTLISTVSCTAVAFLFAYVIARLDVPCNAAAHRVPAFHRGTELYSAFRRTGHRHQTASGAAC